MTDTTLPDPLVPPEVDLRDFGFMPLEVLRLRDSDLAALATGDEFKAAVLLWCVAWHQVPAASLPDDDRLLAKHSQALAGWRKVKAEALRGFVKSADGRLYHPVIAAKATEAWASKQAQRARTAAATAAREAKRRAEHEARERAEQAARDEQRNGERDDSRDVQRDVERDVHQGTGTVKGQGQGYDLNTSTSHEVDRPRPAAEAPALVLVSDPPKPLALPDCPHLEVLALWAEVLPQMPQHQPAQWKGARADHLRARWRETAALKGWAEREQGLAYFRKVFVYVGKSAFLTGRVTPRDPGKPPFVVELAWLVKPENWAKTIEGKYHQEAA